MRRKEKGMEEIVVSDACGDLKKEVQVLRMLLASLTAERDDLRYHVCPELEARYASEIGGLENRANYLNIKIAEMKRRIEIARAALNREKTVSREDMDRQVHREYQKFYDALNEAFRRAEQARKNEGRRRERQRQYEEEWQREYGSGRCEGQQNSASREGTSNAYQSTEGADHTGGGMDSDGANDKKMPDAKTLFRKIVKRIHPDANPNCTERQKELFREAVRAYQEGDVATLQKIYDEVFAGDVPETEDRERTYEERLALRKRLQEQIAKLQAEIAEIRNSFPCNKKELLDSPEALAESQRQLKETIRSLEATLERLGDMLQDIEREMEELKNRRS